jgi:hypothetical protein
MVILVIYLRGKQQMQLITNKTIKILERSVKTTSTWQAAITGAEWMIGRPLADNEKNT